jgi:hypothetical protein
MQPHYTGAVVAIFLFFLYPADSLKATLVGNFATMPQFVFLGILTLKNGMVYI